MRTFEKVIFSLVLVATLGVAGDKEMCEGGKKYFEEEVIEYYYSYDNAYINYSGSTKLYSNSTHIVILDKNGKRIPKIIGGRIYDSTTSVSKITFNTMIFEYDWASSKSTKLLDGLEREISKLIKGREILKKVNNYCGGANSYLNTSKIDASIEKFRFFIEVIKNRDISPDQAKVNREMEIQSNKALFAQSL